MSILRAVGSGSSYKTFHIDHVTSAVYIRKMKLREYSIVQKQSEPARRFFSDTEHFDLVVWYEDSDFKKAIGFQLGYKENPFNTDDEYFISHLPNMGSTLEIKLSKSMGPTSLIPASKTIAPTTERPPHSFFKSINGALEDLPSEIRSFVESHLKDILTQQV